jgi:putative Mg2+ transporter-C (MgtC) family protein
MYADQIDFVNTAIIPFIQLFLALMLGAFLGAERTFAGKTAGVRTFSLVSMGSCLFIVLSQLILKAPGMVTSFDPMRLAAGVVTGIGFLGAGLIIFHDNKLSGLTTAAGLWVSCGIGMAVGFELYSVAFSATLLTLFSFSVMWFLEHRIIPADVPKDPSKNDGKPEKS